MRIDVDLAPDTAEHKKRGTKSVLQDKNSLAESVDFISVISLSRHDAGEMGVAGEWDTRH